MPYKDRDKRLEYWRKYNFEHKEEKHKKCMDSREKKLAYAKKWHAEHKEHDREYGRIYRETHREEIRAKSRRQGKVKRKKVRLKILNLISNGNIKCVQCGCDDIRLLEINHKNGGGGKEIKSKTPSTFYRELYYGKRGTDDLEILCRVCNALDHIERKYGKLPYEIKYNK